MTIHKREKQINESFTPSKLILMGVLRKVGDELYEKGYDENLIDNYINNKSIQMEMSNDGYSFFFNNTLIFNIKSYPQLNDVIDNASYNMIQWFENNIKNIQESKNMAKKQVIRLTEGDLRNIIKESVTTVLNEIGGTPEGQFALGAVRGRALGRTLYNPKYQKPSKRDEQGEKMDKAYFKALHHRNDVEDPKELEGMVKAYRNGFDYGIEKSMHKK